MFITRFGIFPARDCRGGSSERVSECTTFYTVTINTKQGVKTRTKDLNFFSFYIYIYIDNRKILCYYRISLIINNRTINNN